MKKFVCIALVFLMSLQCFYKLGLITYFQLNRESIAAAFCINKEKPAMACHGQCFLNKALEQADASSDTGTAPVAKQSTDFPAFIIAENIYSFVSNLCMQSGNFHYLLRSPEGFLVYLFRPPSF